MYEIRKLNCSEFKEIFRKYTRNDFPLMELRPWFAIRHSWKQGHYAAYSYEEDGQTVAYATIYSGDNIPYLLLDFFAVIPERRGHGIGSAFLNDLQHTITGASGIFIEAEAPDACDDFNEKSKREKRISFYIKNGVVNAGVGCRLFNVDYCMLYLPIDTPLRTQSDIYDAVVKMYTAFYRNSGSRLCRVYKK